MEPKVDYRVHKISPLVPIMNETNPVPTTPSYRSEVQHIFSIHLLLSLPSDLFPSGFHTNNLYGFLSSPFASHTLPIIIIIIIIIVIIIIIIIIVDF
jgi:hypothetical protein